MNTMRNCCPTCPRESSFPESSLGSLEGCGNSPRRSRNGMSASYWQSGMNNKKLSSEGSNPMTELISLLISQSAKDGWESRICCWKFPWKSGKHTSCRPQQRGAGLSGLQDCQRGTRLSRTTRQCFGCPVEWVRNWGTPIPRSRKRYRRVVSMVTTAIATEIQRAEGQLVVGAVFFAMQSCE
jgi:hypothetical protein